MSHIGRLSPFPAQVAVFTNEQRFSPKVAVRLFVIFPAFSVITSTLKRMTRSLEGRRGLFAPPYIENQQRRCVMKMFKTFWIINVLAMLVSVTAVYGAQPDIRLSLSPLYEFAGYTEQETDGAAGGYTGMNTSCQEEFGKNARMCTTKEWFNTHGTQPAPSDQGSAWLQPVLVTTTYLPVTDDILWTDWSGLGIQAASNVRYQELAMCGQWSASGSQRGYIVVDVASVSPDIITTGSCSSARQVTCCTPAQIPPR
jgi:hypothetical protein